MKIAMLAWLFLVAGAVPASAQEPEAQEQEMVLGPEFEQRFDELATWLQDYEAWEKWFEVWGNRVAHNFDNQPLWERRTRPEPPVWLQAECQDDWVDDDGLVASACYIVRHWDEQPLLILQRRTSSLVTSGGQDR